MNPLLIYMLKVSVCISAFYVFYWLMLRNDTHFRIIRHFFISAILVSLLMPANKYYVPLNRYTISNFQEHHSGNMKRELKDDPSDNLLTPGLSSNVSNSDNRIIDWNKWIFRAYLLIVITLMVRFILSLYKIFLLYRNSRKERKETIVIVYNKNNSDAFSFFNWLFIPGDMNGKEKLIAHELIHVKQKHSIDIILVELTAIIMWFNPFVWMMRRSIKLTHEYIADECLLSQGADKIEYQSLLVNTAAEGAIIELASRFNSDIVQRIKMMGKEKSLGIPRLKVSLTFILTIILFIAISCFNKDAKTITAISPTRMNVFFAFLDNPITIAVSDIPSNKISISTDNGSIRGENGEYIIKPVKSGLAHVFVTYKGKVIQTQEFRVKDVPAPVPLFAGKMSDFFTKEEILKTAKVTVDQINFDFEVPYRILSFKVKIEAYDYRTGKSFSSKTILNTSLDGLFNAESISLIKTAEVGQNVIIQDVICIGPDGTEKNIHGISLTII